MQAERRAFLTGRTAPRAVLRPPGAIAESEYSVRCNGCADCATACPSGIVVLAEGLAAIDFSRGECTFCGECAQTCRHEALRSESPARLPVRATISPSCLTVRGVECRVCEDQCATRSIRFSPARGGVRLPHVDLERCNGCGACFAPCPAAAIEFKSLTECTA